MFVSPLHALCPRTWTARFAVLSLVGIASVDEAAAQYLGPIFSPASFSQASLTAQYKLVPGDEITVSVLRHPEFSGDYVVPAAGRVQFPVAGELQVIGLSPAELTQQITAKLRSRLLRPEVSIRLRASRAMRIYVLGDVKNSGAYDMRSGWGIVESLSAAGGLANDVQRKDVKLTLERASTHERITVPLEEALSRTGSDALKVAPGDVLRLDQVADLPVYVTGKVTKPGMYKLREDNSELLAAVAQAGGLTDEASMANVRIVHASGLEETVDLTPALVRGESVKYPKLQGGDMIVVAESLNRFAILGYVSKPGYYPIPQGRTFLLSDAVAQASGNDKRGKLSKVGVVRLENGKEMRKVYDLSKFLTKGDTSQNPIVQAGDVVYVPETGRADNGTIFSALGATAGFLNLFRRY